MTSEPTRVTIVGGGIIGLSCAVHLYRAGFRVRVIDRDPEGDRTSFGNAGAVAVAEILPLPEPGIISRLPGFLFDPLGPLSIRLRYMPWLWPYLKHFLKAANPTAFKAGTTAMAALLSTAMDDHEALLQTVGLSSLLHRQGGLFVYRSEAGRRVDAESWALRKDVGLHAETLDRKAIEALEPALGPEAQCGYFTEDWAHYGDPKVLCGGLLDYLRRSGVEIIAGKVIDYEIKHERPTAVYTSKDAKHTFDHLVIASGAWSHKLSAPLGDFFPLETERGYNTTLPDPGVTVNTMTTFSEDQFVMTPMDMGLRIGGAVEFAGLDAPPNYKRAKALLRLAERYLPGLKTDGGTEWMGHRPSSPDSLPVIDRSSRFRNVYYAFGHGHLGLTGSATTGRIITQLVQDRDPGLDLTPFRITRFNDDDAKLS
jgi:D-amino-acid dehydrogenase